MSTVAMTVLELQALFSKTVDEAFKNDSINNVTIIIFTMPHVNLPWTFLGRKIRTDLSQGSWK